MKLKIWEIAICITLLSAHLAILLSSAQDDSLTSDEPVFILGGYSYWMKNDYKVNMEAGNLNQRWIALPLLFQKPTYPDESGSVNAYFLAGKFIFDSGNDPGRIINSCRFMIMLQSLILGAAIFLCARSIFGSAGGLISLFLYVLEPNIIANGRLATSDLQTSFVFFAAVWAF